MTVTLEPIPTKPDRGVNASRLHSLGAFNTLLGLMLLLLAGCASDIPIKKFAGLKAGATIAQVAGQVGTNGTFKVKVIDGSSQFECRQYGNRDFTFRNGRLLGSRTQANAEFDIRNPVSSREMKRRIVAQFQKPEDIQITLDKAAVDARNRDLSDFQEWGHFIAMIPFGSPAILPFWVATEYATETRDRLWNQKVDSIPLGGGKDDVLKTLGKLEMELGGDKSIWVYRRRGETLIGWEGNRVVFVRQYPH